ncbi:transcriptional repressor NrdR [Candidatus Gracilibacteria bacterium]|nr:transcriptional repressor NrdR [Candidatus Gracilibacteria bacterium]
MICPKCRHNETSVIDSRDTHEQKEIRRRRKCEKCGYRFTTFERIEATNFIVIKRDGSRESYDRQKLEGGIWKACEKRLVTQEQVNKMLNELEEDWASNHGREISSRIIGEGVMERLRKVDEVAYIRFASVYRHFRDLETFRKELQKLFE